MYFVRSASERDLPAIAALLAEVWRATYVPIHGSEKTEALIADWHAPDKIKANMARPDGEYLVADDGERIGGMAFATPSGAGDVKSVKLHQLYVRSDCQRQGVGRDLFAEIETCFPDAKRLILEVDEQNAQAIAFYQGVGMSEAGRTANCGTDTSDIPAIIMEKSLPPEM